MKISWVTASGTGRPVMKMQSRDIIYVGIQLSVVPPPDIAPDKTVLIQQAFLTEGLTYQHVHHASSRIAVIRDEPSPFQLVVGHMDSPLGQVSIEAPLQRTGLALFVKEAEAALRAFGHVWRPELLQFVQVDATLRELYETTREHAFQEVWETVLGQPASRLQQFGQPIRGGGLRLVMDPIPRQDEPRQIEVRIESFLNDTRKLFIETRMSWLPPLSAREDNRVRERLESLDAYVQTHVTKFLESNHAAGTQDQSLR